jgi:hypothetical protein
MKKKLGARAKSAAHNVEEKVMAAEGRRSIKQKVETVKRVTKKALKAGAVAGAVVATAVVMRERKKRKKLNG